MDALIRRLRTDARQLARGKVPTAVRYPAAFRAAALALARPRLGRGVSIARVARDLGLPTQSLGRWLRLPKPPATLGNSRCQCATSSLGFSPKMRHLLRESG
jgi:transposase-like protein